MGGLIKCSNLPEMLYHHVIPFRARQKHMLCLGRRCVLTTNTGESLHTTDKRRALTGTCFMDEVTLAVYKGYRLLITYEIYEYIVTRYPIRVKAACSQTIYLRF